MSTHLLQSRKVIEHKIEELISLLDLLDGNCDDEPDNDNEPSLGWPANGPSALARADHDDREVEDENDEEGGDSEPDGDEKDHSFCQDEVTGRVSS